MSSYSFEREKVAASIVAARLSLPERSLSLDEWPMFESWCATKQLPAMPARPATVAFFVLDSVTTGIEQLTRVLESIAAKHDGLADPTLHPMVAAALHDVAPIERPRSWSKDDEEDWKALPRVRQERIAAREKARDIEVRRCQNIAAEAAKKSSEKETANVEDPATTAGPSVAA